MSERTIKSYHAHVYFDPAQEGEAAALREGVGMRFEATLGRWRHEPVGPHPKAMYQIAFATDVFQSLVPWLMLNHGTLDVLVHPNTGDDLADHTGHAMWLGRPLTLNVDVFDGES